MTICEIVREYLVSHGYDGLASSEDWDGCGCGVGDLMPCGGPRTNCQPADGHPGAGRIYWKCLLRAYSHGPGTDRRVNWPACGKWEEVADA